MLKKSTFGGGVKPPPHRLRVCTPGVLRTLLLYPDPWPCSRCCCSFLVSHSLSGNRGEPLLYTHVATTTSRLLATTLNSCGLLVKVQQLVVAVSYYATTNRLLEHFPLQLLLSAMFWHSVSIILTHLLLWHCPIFSAKMFYLNVSKSLLQTYYSRKGGYR